MSKSERSPRHHVKRHSKSAAILRQHSSPRSSITAMAQSESDAEPGIPQQHDSLQHSHPFRQQQQQQLPPDRPIGLSHQRSGNPKSSGPGGAKILINIVRALLARALFVVHSFATIWMTADLRKENEIWAFALISVSIVIEGSYTIIMRAGDERKWFSPSVLLYILATAPPIWLLEATMCDWRNAENTNRIDDKIHLQLLEQLLLVILIIGRWLLPKGKISREQLSQILLAYLAMSSDIVEFFDVFKERPVYSDKFVQYVVLSAWTLSLLQFPFVLTLSRARKMRVAITDEVYVNNKKTTNAWQAVYDIDLWAILLANSLQDIPFLAVRLYLFSQHGLLTYTMAFFICKNLLIIALQTYRAFVLFNDRYVHPGSGSNGIFESTNSTELYDSNNKHPRRHQHRKGRKGNNANESLENTPIHNNNRRSSSQPRSYGALPPSSRSPHRRAYRQVRSSIDEEE
uniref:Transmembrane protein 26 n=1 Tax=Panagrolaimus sp. PS1159 TaxID=55785 RepID=A0AC35EXU5_9BILA